MKSILASTLLMTVLMTTACMPHIARRGSNAQTGTTSTSAAAPASAPAPKGQAAQAAPPSGTQTKQTWVEKSLKKIEDALDKNPVAIAEYLPALQNEIMQNSGFQLRCDDGLLSGFKAEEQILCYTAIKSLLTAIKNGLAPRNPADGFPIEEIVIVKKPSRLYEPIDGRYGLEVNYMISAAEWPALLRSQIESFARTRETHRLRQVNGKLDALTRSLFVSDIEVQKGDRAERFTGFERVTHALEQAVTLEASLRSGSAYAGQASALKGKIYELIRVTDQNMDVFEDGGRLYVGLSPRDLRPQILLTHLLRQPNIEGRELTPLQVYLLKKMSPQAIDAEYGKKSIDALEVTVMRDKVTRLRDDIQYEMLEGKIAITYTFDRTKDCTLFVFCSTKGISVKQAHDFLMNLRAALSGGKLTGIAITEIRIEPSGWNHRQYMKDKHITYAANASVQAIYKGLWETTPDGIEAAKNEIRMRQLQMGGIPTN